MKKIKINKKLILNKEVVVKLTDKQMNNVIGGAEGLSIYGCPTNAKTRRNGAGHCCDPDITSTPQNNTTCTMTCFAYGCGD